MALFKVFRGKSSKLNEMSKVDGHAYFCTDDGSFHIDYVDADGNLQRKQVNEQQLEELGYKIDNLPQADWNQNCDTEKDYIKNRPTWTNDTVTEIANGEYTSEFVEDLGAYGIIIEMTAVGSRLDFTLDGENYSYKLEDCTVIDGMVYAGNLSKINPLLGTDYPDTGESFILATDGSVIMIGTDFTQSTTHNIMLSVVTPEVQWDSTYSNWFDENYVTRNTYQEIHADKDFYGNISVNNANIFVDYKRVATEAAIKEGNVIAKKAECDADGNIIKDTYLTVEENNRQVAELNNEVIIAIFNIENNTTKIYLSNLNALEIDWGDGTINSDLIHSYKTAGFYTCKIYGCTSIGKEAFYYCSSLTSVTIGNSVTSIGDSAFFHCKSLTNVIIGNSVISIGDNAFSSCDNLTSITIGNSVTSIGNWAFQDCSSLTSVIISDSVTFINSSAFYDCTDLIDITFKNPAPITYHTAWFTNCTSLTHLYVPYGCAEAYRTKWAEDGASEDILNLIVESDREAYMSDLDGYATQEYVNEQLEAKVAELEAKIAALEALLPEIVRL